MSLSTAAPEVLPVEVVARARRPPVQLVARALRQRLSQGQRELLAVKRTSRCRQHIPCLCPFSTLKGLQQFKLKINLL